MNSVRLLWRFLRYRVALMLIMFFLLGVSAHERLDAHPWQVVVLCLALAASYVSATSVNDLADYKIDKINHPNNRGRPLVTKEATAKDVKIVFAIASLAAVGLASLAGTKPALIIAGSILINMAYSLRPLRLSYRTFLPPLILGIAYVGIPYVLGASVSGQPLGGLDWLWLVGLYLMFIGRIILKDFRDREGDLKYHKPTFLLRFGKPATCRLSFVCIIAGGLILAWLVRDKWWLAGLTLVYVGAILFMLYKLSAATAFEREQFGIGLGAKMGNGLLIALLASQALQYSELQPGAQATTVVLLSLLFYINFVNFLLNPQIKAVGYKG